MLAVLDADGDGAVTLAELRQATGDMGTRGE